MRFSALLAASAALAFVSAGPVAAQERWSGWHVDGIIASTTQTSSSEDLYFTDIEPSGTQVGIAAGYRFIVGRDLIVGVEASVAYGPVEDSTTMVFCTVAECGYNEEVTYTVSSSYRGRLGIEIGHTIGSTLVSAVVGIEVRDRAIYTEVESDDPDADEYFYDESQPAIGPYFGLRVDHPVSDRIAIGVEWTRSDVVQSTIIEFDGERYEDGGTYDSFQFRLSRRF